MKHFIFKFVPSLVFFLAILFSLQNKSTLLKFDSYKIYPDSRAYALKWDKNETFTPPVYHILIEKFGHVGLEQNSPDIGQHVISGQNNPFLKIAKFQKILLLTSIFILFITLYLFGLPLLSLILFLATFFSLKLYGEYTDAILTDSIAQSLVILSTTLLISWLYTKKHFYFYFICSILIFNVGYLLRPSSVFLAIVPFTIFATNIRKNFNLISATSIISFMFITLTASIVFFENSRLRNSDNKVNIADPVFMQDFTKFIYATLFLNSNNINKLTFDRSRDFADSILKNKSNFSGEHIPSDPYYLKIIVPALNVQNLNSYSKEAHEIYKDFNNVFIKDNEYNYIKYKSYNFIRSILKLGKVSVLNPYAFFCALLSILYLLYSRKINELLISMTCLCLHFSHMFIVTIFLYPIPRYVEQTEFLILFPLLFVTSNLISKFNSFAKRMLDIYWKTRI